MKVKDLIERLESTDKNAEVVVIDSEFNTIEIEKISTKNGEVIIFLE